MWGCSYRWMLRCAGSKAAGTPPAGRPAAPPCYALAWQRSGAGKAQHSAAQRSTAWEQQLTWQQAQVCILHIKPHQRLHLPLQPAWEGRGCRRRRCRRSVGRRHLGTCCARTRRLLAGRCCCCCYTRAACWAARGPCRSNWLVALRGRPLAAAAARLSAPAACRDGRHCRPGCRCCCHGWLLSLPCHRALLATAASCWPRPGAAAAARARR